MAVCARFGHQSHASAVPAALIGPPVSRLEAREGLDICAAAMCFPPRHIVVECRLQRRLPWQQRRKVQGCTDCNKPTEGMCGQARSKTGYLSEIVTSYQPIIRTGNAPRDVGRGGEGAASEPQQPALVAEAVERRSLGEVAEVTGQKRSVEAVVAAADKARQRSARNVVHHTNRRASPNHRTNPNVHASPNRRANRLGTSRRRASLPLKRARQV